MKLTTSIIWDHRGRATKGGKGQLEVRITADRKSYYIGTGIKVHKSEFMAGRIVGCMGADGMNERLAIIYNKVLACVSEYEKNESKVDINAIRSKVYNTIEAQSDEPAFLDWCENQILMLNLSEGTAKHYRSLLARLVEFGEMKRWQDVTVENISRFDAWLHQRKTVTGTPISPAGVYKYHKCLKALLYRADRYGKIDRNPYERLKGQFKHGDKENIEYLTEDELKKFEYLALPLGSPLDMAHDLFIFQVYTGLSYSDAQAFNINDYKWDGMRWINNGERIKTGVPYVSSILPPALHVLEKYDMKVPRMNNADYNHQLKALGLMAGIKTRLHSHLARHTFATYMLRNGAKIENVSRMLGHTNIRQTQRYAKVLAQSVHEDFDMIAQKLKNKDKGR
jgi:integrase